MDQNILAALIGAAAALATIVLRDVVIAPRREKSASRKKVQEIRLEKIYSPLMAWMGQKDPGNAMTISVIRNDEILRRDVQAYLHLLSGSLRDMAIEVMTMGEWNGSEQIVTMEERRRLLTLSSAFRDQLISEYQE
jgi:hypothetical protein